MAIYYGDKIIIKGEYGDNVYVKIIDVTTYEGKKHYVAESKELVYIPAELIDGKEDERDIIRNPLGVKLEI